MNEPILIEQEYQIPLSMFDRAFCSFQKRFVYPRNFVITGILLAVIIIYVRAAILDPSNTMAYLLIVASAAVICIQWFNPRKIRRNLMTSLKELEGDQYRMTLTQGELRIGTILTAEKLAAAAEDEPEAEKTPEEPASQPDDGFQDVFDEAPAQPDIAETILPLDAQLTVTEQDEFFMIYQKKSMFYVLPKQGFSQEELTLLCQTLRNTLGDHFKPLQAKA